jgi:hypothetical protein
MQVLRAPIGVRRSSEKEKSVAIGRAVLREKRYERDNGCE